MPRRPRRPTMPAHDTDAPHDAKEHAHVMLPAHRTWRLASLAVVLSVAWLSAACTGPTVDKTYSIATVFPTTGPAAAVGLAMQRAVDLAVSQNTALGKGYTLTVSHTDEATTAGSSVATTLASDHHVMGIVGPFDSQTAITMLPTLQQNTITTISPTATLPGLTLADKAAAENVPFAQLHPQGKPNVFFRLPQTDDIAGKVAADLALAPAAGHGLAARNIFIVDDGTSSGLALAAAFIQELKAKHVTALGQQSITAGSADSIQSAVVATIRANADIVFFAGAIDAGAELRHALALYGVPQLVLLTAGHIAADPGWSATVELVPASAYTTALLPAQDLSKLATATAFVTAYQSAFSGKDLLPQSALAYDAAMDEIAAIKSIVASGKPVTRAAVLTAVTAAKYAGVTGTLTFDKNGDNTTPLGFSLYTCDIQGAWHYQASFT